jgi:hypothetical protein
MDDEQSLDEQLSLSRRIVARVIVGNSHDIADRSPAQVSTTLERSRSAILPSAL